MLEGALLVLVRSRYEWRIKSDQSDVLLGTQIDARELLSDYALCVCGRFSISFMMSSEIFTIAFILSATVSVTFTKLN